MGQSFLKNNKRVVSTACDSGGGSTAITQVITNGDTTHSPSGNVIYNELLTKANINSPTFTGIPLTPTPTINSNNTQISTTGYVDIKTPFVTPEMYGAVGNGTTDDSTAIQNAINSGFPVLLSKKNYRVSSTLTVINNVKIFGLGKESILSTISNVTTINITGDYNTFENFTILGNTAGTSQWGIVADGNAGFTLPRINNIINKCYFLNLHSGVVSRNMIGTISGTRMEGSFTISDSIFNACTKGFAALVRGEYNILVNNKFEACTTGVELTGGNNSIIGGQIVNCTTGIQFISGSNDAHGVISNVKINHNTTQLSAANGIEQMFIGCTFYAGNITITGTGRNLFSNCTFSMGANTMTITNSPVIFYSCYFAVVPGTYTLTGTQPQVINCFNGSNIMTSPKDIYTENTVFSADGTFIVPSASSIVSITIQNTTANTVTGGIRIGTTAGASDVVTAQAVAGNDILVIKDADILKRIFSSSVNQTLFIQAVTAWNGASLKILIKLKQNIF